MKFLVVFACALAAVSAGYVAPVATLYGAQHFPVINHEGVPIDTAAVQHATASHLAHKANVHVRNGDAAVAAVSPVAPVVAAHAPVVAAAYAAAPYYHHAYPTTAVAPASVNGVPLETPEVVAAKVNHFAAHSEALARTGYPSAVVYRHRRGIYAAAPVAYSAAYTTPFVAAPYYHHAYPTTAVAPTSVNGVPLETPEVVAAKVNHFAAHSEALARTGYPSAVVYRHRRGIYTPAPVAYTASTYGYTSPVVASTYAHTAPFVASTYAHAAPVAHYY